VIEDGLIAEQGPHDELVRAGGRYAKLWEAFRRGERHGPVIETIPLAQTRFPPLSALDS
jgi:hypothetical protein